MRLGVHVIAFTVPDGAPGIAPELARVGQAVEAAGVTHLSVMDHYFQMDRVMPATDPMLEGYTTLGYLAAVTERVRLSLLVTGATYRRPGLLAKTVTTLDVLSRGRAMLGIGAAWYEREHDGLGVPFPPLKERFERLEETLQICRQMWSEDDGHFTGTHYRLAETVCVPPPVQRPHPPVLIGGSGERRTLRLVAEYADACNLFGESPDRVAHKLDVLRAHCDDVGRDYDTIQKTMIGSVDPLADVDGFLADMERYAALGISLVALVPAGDDPVAWTTGVCEKVLPRLAAL